MIMITCKNNYGDFVELPAEKFQPRPSIYAILRRDDYILVCRQKSNGKLWFPGGGVEEGEDHRSALLRECLEETGIKNITVGNLLGDLRNYFYYEPTDLAMDAQLYFYECFTDEEAVCPNHEVEDDESFDFTWMKVAHIKPDDMADLNTEVYTLLTNLKYE